ASSPKTNAALSPRKCAATTAPPARTGRVRSTTEGVLARVSVMPRPPSTDWRAALDPAARPSRQAAFEAVPDLLLRQLAADEDDAAFALLVVLPWALVIAVEDHVHALEHESVRIVLEREDALAAQDVRPFCLHEVLHPGKELVGIERLVALER